MRDEGKKNRSRASFIPHPSSLIPPKRRFGQNFLADERVVERIVREVSPRRDETIVEIGPGRGALTSRLIDQAGRLVAIELDRDLVPLLQEKFGGGENFSFVEGDALTGGFFGKIFSSKEA